MPMAPLDTAGATRPSTLVDVLQAITDLFREAGSAVPVLVGEHYVSGKGSQTIASPPLVILVPEPDGGACELGPAYETGRAASQKHTCDVIVRAAEGGTDIERHRAAYALNDFTVGAVKRATTGRAEFGQASKPYPSPFTSATGAGVQLAWGFVYSRDIAIETEVYQVPAGVPEIAPAAPYGQPGETGTLSTITSTITVPDEES